MRAEVKTFSSVVEFMTPERCFISEIANDSGDPQVSIVRARVEPGVTTAWHKLKDVNERYIIVAGKGHVEVQGMEPVDVSLGDIVRIPANSPQRIANTSKEDLVFFCICSPPFQIDSYEALE